MSRWFLLVGILLFFCGGCSLLVIDHLPSPFTGPEEGEFYPDSSGAETADAYFSMYRRQVGEGLTKLASRVRSGEFSSSLDVAKGFSESTAAARSAASEGVDERFRLLSREFENDIPGMAPWIEDFAKGALSQ